MRRERLRDKRLWRREKEEWVNGGVQQEGKKIRCILEQAR